MPSQSLPPNGASNGTSNGLEPRFSLPSSTPRSSKTPLVIGGVQIYIYGLQELQQTSGCEVAVLYLAHNRTRTYLVTENIAHEILHRYRTDGTKKRIEMIAVTMNMRNHGAREVSPEANLTWTGGNENHGVDLISMISGSAQDFKLVIDFLPAYLKQFSVFRNIMMGVSLGGHTAWRMASLAPGKFEAFVIVVGCPNLTSLLVERLGIDPNDLGTKGEELDTVSYERLLKVMNDQQRQRWPLALAELVREGDRKVYEEFPTHLPLLMCNGVHDDLVPARYTSSWMERTSQVNKGSFPKNEMSRLFVQENTGHSCTKEMVNMIAEWLINMYKS